MSSDSDLKRAFLALKAKGPAYDRLYAYYDGEHPLKYTASRLRKVFQRIDATMSENWTAVVVDSLLDRLDLDGVKAPKQMQDAASALWTGEQLDLEADEAHADVAICGESFVIVWPESPGEPAQVFRNDPRLCHAFYEPSNPRRMAFAAKWWEDEGDERRHLTMYYPDRFDHYVSSGKATDVTNEKSFSLEDSQTHDAGRIPVFHLRTRRRRIFGELQNAIVPQDMLNMTLSNMMVTSEFASFRQRWAITNADVDGKTLKSAPDRVTVLPAADSGAGEQPTQVGEFEGSDPTRYLDIIAHFANTMARITRTPSHFFFEVGAGVSGDALIAAEAPLVGKALRYQSRLGSTWSEIVAFALQQEGNAVLAREIIPTWADAHSSQPQTEATTVKTLVEATVPLRTALRRAGWTEEDIAQLDKDKQEDARAGANMGTAYLAAARMVAAQPPAGGNA